ADDEQQVHSISSPSARRPRRALAGKFITCSTSRRVASSMKPPSFDYATPATLAEATGLLAAHDGEAKLLSGGQSLVPLLNMRLARPALLVDLAQVPDLDYVRAGGAGLVIGAMTRQRSVELAPVVRERHPLLHAGML